LQKGEGTPSNPKMKSCSHKSFLLKKSSHSHPFAPHHFHISNEENERKFKPRLKRKIWQKERSIPRQDHEDEEGEGGD
jgi:hypothetical protein